MPKGKKNKKTGFWKTVLAVAIFSLAGYFLISADTVTVYENEELADDVASSAVVDPEPEPQKEKVKYVATPESTKVVYMTACVASTVEFKQDIVDLIKETELNSIIIDIKDFSGTISFDTGLAGDNSDGCRAKNIPEFVAELHEMGVYVIGRVTVFQDPYYSKLHPELAVKKNSDRNVVWADDKGINFIEVGAKPYWDYVIDLAKLSHQAGFDEINFDYVRFPSDGNMKDIYFPFSNSIIESNPGTGKAIALEEFFKYLHAEIAEYNKDLENPLITSADLFGMTTTSSDDLNIGQVLERALPYFDYIAPMVYPSHYPPHFNGWADPDDVPYELIKYAMQGAIDKVNTLKTATTTPSHIAEKVSTDQLRTWIQDFDYGGDYGPVEVREQIQATYDVGLDSWMLWAPSNRYTRGALLDK